MGEFLGTILGSVFSGGATGLLGVVAQRFADYKNAQLQMKLEQQRGELELAKRKADAEIMAQEWAGRLKVAEREGTTAEAVADSAAFKETMFKEPERYSNIKTLTPMQNWFMILLDVLRGSVRPALTIYLCILTTVVWRQVKVLIATEDLDPAAALEIWKRVVDTILYLTVTVTLWWFGTRNKQAAPKT